MGTAIEGTEEAGEERALARRGGAELPSPRVTPGMRTALTAGAAVFAVGTLIQLVAIAWVAIGIAITAVAGSILARTGGLEPSTFRTCVIAAIVLDAVLFLQIVVASIAKRVNQAEPGADRLFLRRPVMLTTAGLLTALLIVTAAGWKRSPYFPYPLATIIVLANAYFFALISVLYTGRVVDRLWAPLKAWALTSPYRAGFLTATLLLAGGAGYALRKADWTRESVQRLAAEIDLRRLRTATGFVDAQLAGLCIAADETAPELARGPSAPSCHLPGAPGGSAAGLLGSGEDCFTTLEPDVGRAKSLLRTELRISAYDADDLAMEALLRTCLREPLPQNLRAYFFRVARNLGWKAKGSARRMVTCDDVDAHAPPPTCSTGLPEHRELELELAWRYTFCTLDDRAAGVVRSRLVDELSFRMIGERLTIPEHEARYIFHNALKKLRRELAACFP